MEEVKQQEEVVKANTEFEKNNDSYVKVVDSFKIKIFLCQRVSAKFLFLTYLNHTFIFGITTAL